MEYEFDKEIDSLLRQARPETDVSEQFNAHPDADEISLFAENVLPQKARTRVTAHLADCAKCRKILSNVIVLNAEVPSENLHAEESKPAAETAIPWYRKLFAFPQLAYTMGGLTVLLTGMIGYVALQSYNEPKNDSIAQMEKSVERPRGAGGVSSDGETVTVEKYSANAANSVAAAASPAVSSANAASNAAAAKPGVAVSSANANAAASTLPKGQSPTEPAEPPAAAASSVAERERSAESKAANAESTFSMDGANVAAGQQNSWQTPVARNRVLTPDSQNAQAARRAENLRVQGRQTQDLPMVAQAPAQAAPPKDDDSPKERAVKKEVSEKAKSVGGRSFIYKDNVWYDKSYRQQKTVNVHRETDDYKKLDSGLRSIADSLGGIVVIVWNGRAYRIQ